MKKRKNRRRKKSNKKTFFKNVFQRLITILILILLIYFPFFVFKNIKKAVWDGKNNFNFVIQSERTFIFSYHPPDELLNIVSLPQDLYLRTAKGYGEYRLANIYQLGELEKIGGEELLKTSLSQFFKVPIDGAIVDENQSLEVKDKALAKGKLTSVYPCLITGKCKTNMSWWDLLRVFSKLSQLKFNQIRLVNIEETGLFKKEKLADQSLILKLENSLINDFSQIYFTDKRFLNEGLKINMVNATNYPGLAKNSSHLLKNIGGEIITTEASNEALEESTIYYAQEEVQQSYSLRKIKQMFQIDKLILDENIKGDIKIVLGKDFLNKFYLQ